MNSFEKFVYDTVKRYPKLKFFLRDAYQQCFDLLPVKAELSAYPITARKNCFFGFHDHTPFSPDNKKLLAGRFDIPLRMPTASDRLEVGYFDGANFENFNPVSTTKAWNWHQGAKMQWVGPQNTLSFNDHENGENVAKLFNLESGILQTLPAAISAISKDGKFAIGYSFARVQRYMPGYGYEHPTSEAELEKPIPKQSGIYVIDMETLEKRDLFSIDDIVALDKRKSAEHCHHFLSHALFSPSGKRFAFLHRWVTNDVRNRKSTLFTSDLSGTDIRIYPTDEMASHLGWRDENHLLAYCRTPKRGDRYVLFDDRNPEEYEIIGADSFSSDGHPSYDPSGRWFVTDTYPDRTRRCSLILFDQLRSEKHLIAKLKSPKKFATTDPSRHWQCDLHPRWDRLGKYICFDSTYTGERALCTIHLDDDLIDDVRNLKAIL